MIWFLLRRLVWIGIVLWAVFTVTFLLMRSVPGGPFTSERKLPPEVEANFRARYHLDKPLEVQYLLEARRLLQFDLGPSARLGDFSVNEIIAQGWPVSASLGVLAMAFALALGLSAGILSAVRRGGWLDAGLMSLATLGVALPEFLVASGAVIVFVFWWGLFPAAGWGTPQQLVLPALCLGAPYAAYIARLTRSGMLDILSQDFIRTAQAKGLPGSRIVLRHALKGALVPVLSFLSPATAGILTGSLVVEQVFAVPGLGMHFVQAVFQRDFTLAMGLVLLYTLLLSVLNLLTDVAYRWLDPRVRIDG